MVSETEETPATITVDALRPYASFVILRYTGPDIELASTAMMTQLRKLAARKNARRTTQIIAEGFDPAEIVNALAAVEEPETMEIRGFISRVTSTPSWAKPGSAYSSIEDELSLVFRRDSLVAVHCPKPHVAAIQRWLDNKVKPGFERVSGNALQLAFLEGDARGLWLRGTHRRQSTKADTKNLTGSSLGQALDPINDGSFALTSGRATVDPARNLDAIEGVVGVTPRKSWTWNRRAESLAEFVAIADETLRLVEASIDHSSDTPFPELAEQTENMDGVHSAFDAYLAEPDEIRQHPDAGLEAIDASEKLTDSITSVSGSNGGPSFTLGLGRRSATTGTLLGRPRFDADRVEVEFRVQGTPSDEVEFRSLRNSLQPHWKDLLTVYYESGHVLSNGVLTKVNITQHRFRHWKFKNFNGLDSSPEKPAQTRAQEMHDMIAEPADGSLFGWVVGEFDSGFLTCDDGTSEVADFVHLSHAGTLSLIHVKAALSGASRRVAAGAFEVVSGQATKNLRYLERDRLIQQLMATNLERPATWKDGRRVHDRSEMLEAIRSRPTSAESRVIIVQPHLTRTLYECLMAADDDGEVNVDLRRLQLIGWMLNAARTATVGQGAELEVWVSDR